jgi:hypothetical protein
MHAVSCRTFTGYEFQSSVVFPRWDARMQKMDLVVCSQGWEHFCTADGGLCHLQNGASIFAMLTWDPHIQYPAVLNSKVDSNCFRAG